MSAPDAAIIYALDPVYGAGFSYLLLGETLGPQGAAGARLVLTCLHLPYISPISRLYLAHISPISRLYLAHIYLRRRPRATRRAPLAHGHAR